MFVSNNAAALIFYLVEGAECSYNIDRLMMIRMRLSFSFFLSCFFTSFFGRVISNRRMSVDKIAGNSGM
jgi:hypothetical protein